MTDCPGDSRRYVGPDGINQPQADACIAALASEREILISAGTVAEALIVAR
jgi:hypothetical protein